MESAVKIKKNLMIVSSAVLLLFLGACSNILGDFGKATLIDFESVSLPAAGYIDASTADPAHTINGVKFASHYDSTWGTSSGTTISSLKDTTTAGYTNAYSAYPGSGALSSVKFAVLNPSGTDPIIDFQETVAVKSVYVANNTYAALSMQNGDAFAKKFTNADQDYFIVVFEGFDSTGTSTGKVEYYLADFRNGTNTGILASWAKVDLSPLGDVRKIGVSFKSSDVGTYGINTPLYVVIDNLEFVKP